MKLQIVKGFQKTSEVFVSPEHKSSGFLCFNVIVGGVSRSDLRSFFGPLTGDEVFLHLEDTHWANLLKTLGIFPSAGQARKNGWDKEIPVGFSEASFKKQRTVVFVFRQPLGRWDKAKEKLWTVAQRFSNAISRRWRLLWKPIEVKQP